MLETWQKMLYTLGEEVMRPVKNAGEYSREGYLKENYRYFHLRDTAGQERDFHFHDFDKAVILLSGRVDYIVEGESYALQPWNVLLVKHHTIHKALIDKSEPYERIIIYLDRRFFDRGMPGAQLMNCFDAADRPGRHLLVPGPEQRRTMERLFAAYEWAQRDEGFGAQTLRDTLIIQLPVFVCRMGAAQQGSAGLYDEKIEQALSYINEHLSGELSVELLAEQVYLSKYHFMRLFKAQTGSTVHAYVRQKRLMSAARLIREGVPVNKAAADSGFADYSSFHRAFRETFGINPGALKK